MNHGTRGQAMVEFALVLPFMLVILGGIVALSLVLGEQITLIHTSREAAGYFSRGATFQETFAAITAADGTMDLDGPNGRIILTEIELNADGTPVIASQQTVGGLMRNSVFGTPQGGGEESPATIPNGMTLPEGMSLWGVELYRSHDPLAGFLADIEPIVLAGVSAF